MLLSCNTASGNNNNNHIRSISARTTNSNKNNVAAEKHKNNIMLFHFHPTTYMNTTPINISTSTLRSSRRSWKKNKKLFRAVVAGCLRIYWIKLLYL